MPAADSQNLPEICGPPWCHGTWRAEQRAKPRQRESVRRSTATNKRTGPLITCKTLLIEFQFVTNGIYGRQTALFPSQETQLVGKVGSPLSKRFQQPSRGNARENARGPSEVAVQAKLASPCPSLEKGKKDTLCHECVCPCLNYFSKLIAMVPSPTPVLPTQ